MKPVIVSVLMGLSAVAGSLAQTDTNVYSPNAVGFVKVDLPANALVLIAAPLNTVGSGASNATMTLDQVLGTNGLNRASDAGNGADEVYLWTGGGYSRAWLNDDSWHNDTTPIGIADWKWCFQDADGYPAVCSSDTNFNITVGQGLWLQHKANTTALFLAGEVPSASTTTVLLHAGLTMIANPYPVARTLDELISTNTPGVSAASDAGNGADEIYLWTGGGYSRAWLNDDGWHNDTTPVGIADWKWCFQDADGYPVACSTSTNYTVKPGQGLWYCAKQGTNFIWTVTKPY
ncbi:MAG: hypothetical protein NTV49_04520 [Kiritimatiellaeota bacterium]|nr:hypothetical protein [Kiritimatiellota bacterium]